MQIRGVNVDTTPPQPFSWSVVRNPDFIYKQVHNPDVTNPDLADVRVTHLFVSP